MSARVARVAIDFFATSVSDIVEECKWEFPPSKLLTDVFEAFVDCPGHDILVSFPHWKRKIQR